MKTTASKIMNRFVPDHTDPLTGETNLTGLAEATADEMGQHEWLDDPDHWIWDMAIEVGA